MEKSENLSIVYLSLRRDIHLNDKIFQLDDIEVHLINGFSLESLVPF